MRPQAWTTTSQLPDDESRKESKHTKASMYYDDAPYATSINEPPRTYEERVYERPPTKAPGVQKTMEVDPSYTTSIAKNSTVPTEDFISRPSPP